MRIIPYDDKTKAGWKSYPVRIQGTRACCNQPTLLVQSMSGGFVTQNCTKCETINTLRENEFIHKISRIIFPLDI